MLARVGAMTVQETKEDGALLKIAASKIAPVGFRQVETRLRAMVPAAEFEAARAAGETNAADGSASPSPTTQPFQTEEGVTLRPWTSSRVKLQNKMFAYLGQFRIVAGGQSEYFMPERQIASGQALVQGGGEMAGCFFPTNEVGASTASKTFVLKIEALGLLDTARVVVNGQLLVLNKISEGVYACMFTANSNFMVRLPLQGIGYFKFVSMSVKRFSY